MIHVAERGEDKGRVVVHLCSGTASPVALDAAVWLARAFQSEIEGLFVESLQLIELASFPFASEISLSGRGRRQMSREDIERELRAVSADFLAGILQRARAAEIPVRQRIVRDDPIRALIEVCAASGPWNAVALAEPFTSLACPPLKELLDQVQDATGLLIVGPRASRTSGPVVIALEQAELLPAMIGTAEKLAAVDDKSISVCLVAADEQSLMELDTATRLVLSEHPGIALAASSMTFGAEAAAAEVLRRLMPGLILARFGGVLISESGDLRPLAASLECPLLLLR